MSLALGALVAPACGSDDADGAGAASSGAGAAGPGSTTGSGGGGATGGGGAITVPPECTALAVATCARLEACSPASMILPYGTVETCQAREARRCASTLMAPDTGYSIAQVEDCTAAYDGATCDGVLLAVEALCAPSGARALGDPCAAGAQCESGRCGAAPPSGSGGAGGAGGGPDGAPTGCGVCAARAEVGESCAGDPGACAPGSRCVAEACVAVVPFGASCAAGAPCDLGLVCDGSICVPGGAAGAACSAMAPCDPGAWLSCAAGACAAPVWAEGGQVCVAAVTGDPVPVCIASSHCGGGGICVSAAEDGSECGGAPGVACYPPAVCSAGFCTLPHAMQCE